MRGAGGTDGGILRFFVGLAMMIGGGYLFFNSIRVESPWHWGLGMYHFGDFALTGGILLIPLMFGIVFLFYDARSPVGWVLAAGSLLALIFGVVRSIQFRFQSMPLTSLLIILVLLFGGIGLFLSSLRDFSAAEPSEN